MKEIWKTVKVIEEDGTEIIYSDYQVSNLGRVRNLKHNRFLKPSVTYQNYRNVKLYLNPKTASVYFIHRLVAFAFLKNPTNKPLINHIDGDKSNNVLFNLEWSTQSENMLHAARTGLHPHEYNRQPILDKETGKIYKSLKDLANDLDIKYAILRNRIHNNTYGFKDRILYL